MPRTTGERVCRVRPDLPALDRTFDYLVPEAMGAAVTVGTIVRVPLHGRRVRGWVVADDVVPDTEGRLLPVAKVVGAGPPAEVMDLCRWVAWRWAGPEVLVLRAASPPNAVREAAAPPAETGGSVRALRPRREVIAWPPAGDRRDLVAERISPHGSTLVIVPEALRLPALLRHLERAGHRVLRLRADETDAARSRAWSAARAGRCVVVGGRTAVWAPVPDLAAVVVLDEGDEALQEERAPTWHARDVAVERATRAGASLTLVGVVPTLEAEAVAGPAVRPDRAAEREGWPLLEAIDLRDQPPGTGLLTDGLARAVHQAVDRGGRAVCVLNRKGRARLLACVACAELARCERCGTAVAEDEGRVLRCPRCEAERPVVCLHCHATRMKSLRPGIARLRDDLAALLPRVEVAEVDTSTEAVPSVPVLVGTEAVLHRVPRGAPVLAAVFLDFDQELLAPRARAAEQALALLARAARLLGPRSRGGRLVVQTRLVGHEVLETARHADPSRLADAERPRREALGYPPFGALAEVSGVPDAVRAALDALAGWSDLTVLGPTSTASGGLRALVRAPTVPVLCDSLANAARLGRAEGRLRVAVDPLRV